MPRLIESSAALAEQAVLLCAGHSGAGVVSASGYAHACRPATQAHSTLCGQPSSSGLVCHVQVGGEASRASSDSGRSDGSAAMAGAKKRPKNGGAAPAAGAAPTSAWGRPDSQVRVPNKKGWSTGSLV